MNRTLVGLFVLAIVALGGFLVFSLVGDGNVKPPKPKVATTIYPLYSLAEEIAGGTTDVTLILKAGQSPHTFEPSASLIRELQGADVLFAIGAELDTWVADISKNVPGSQVVNLNEFVTLKPFEDNHKEDEDDHDDDEDTDEHSYGEYDPHYWLSPTQALILVDIMANYIAANDPENLAVYSERAQALKENIRAKNSEWETEMDKLTNKEIVTFHNAFGYFADHFGLTVLATFEPFPGKEPTPKYLAELSEEIKKYNVKTMFLEPQLSKSAIETFAKDNNITLGTLDPLGGDRGKMSYIDLIDYNVKAIVEANQ